MSQPGRTYRLISAVDVDEELVLEEREFERAGDELGRVVTMHLSMTEKSTAMLFLKNSRWMISAPTVEALVR